MKEDWNSILMFPSSSQQLNKIRKHLAVELGAQLASLYVLDTEPVPVVGYKRSKKNSDFFGSAEYGHCASKKLNYWGYKLVMLVTADGIPVATREQGTDRNSLLFYGPCRRHGESRCKDSLGFGDKNHC